MRIIILGAGQVGRTAAYHLSREEANDVTVVDQNEEILRDLPSSASHYNRLWTHYAAPSRHGIWTSVFWWVIH